MTGYTIQTTLGLGWFLLGIVPIIALSIWSYRWTSPPMPVWGRGLMAALRAVALLCVWGLICGVEIHWERSVPAQTGVAVLMDKSSSMLRSDNGSTRNEIAANLFESPEWISLQDRLDVQYYGFADHLFSLDHRNLDSSPDGPVTNIYEALHTLQQEQLPRLDAVLLLSDGAVNEGGALGEIARQVEAPIFTIGLGDSLPPRDVVIREIFTPDINYVGDPVPVDVTVLGIGLSGQRQVVRINASDGRELAVDTITFQGEWSEQTLQFEITPAEAQEWDLEIATDTLAGEHNLANNRRHTVVHVAERRKSILLVSPGPNPDASFLARTIENNEDVEATILIGAGSENRFVRGSIPSQEDMTEVDGAIILLEGRYSPNLLRFLQNRLPSELPLIIFTGESPDRQALDLLTNRIGPLEMQRNLEHVDIYPETSHPVFTLDGNWFERGTAPPPVNIPRATPLEGKVLAVTGPGDGDRPVLIERTGAARTLIFFMGGLWKWDLAMRPVDPAGAGYSELWQRAIRWLTTAEERARIVVEPSKSLYTGGETVELTAQVYDEAFRPLETATVSAQVRNGDESRTIEFESLGGGRYRARFPAWNEGRYEMDAEVEVNGGSFERSGSFVVDAFSLEDLELRMRPDRLRLLAQNSGGLYLTLDDMDRVAEWLPLRSGTEYESGFFRPLGRWRTLLFIVIVLGIEWLVRTRRGML